MTLAETAAVDRATPTPVIALHDLTLAYERRPAIHHLSGSFDPGSLTAIVGPNGAGKTTLLKAICGFLRPAAGHVDRPGLRRGDIAFLPQHAEIDRQFPISVADTVMLGHWRRLGWVRGATDAMRESARAALAAVGLDGFERRIIGTLSAGQFQRVLFARLMVQDARLILLDEPFAGVDARTTEALLGVVSQWHDERRTIVAVLHDLDQVRAHFPATLLIARERIGWGPTDQILTVANLRRARNMSEAWSVDAEHCDHVPA